MKHRQSNALFFALELYFLLKEQAMERGISSFWLVFYIFPTEFLYGML